jgi:hypothetical protein
MFIAGTLLLGIILFGTGVVMAQSNQQTQVSDDVGLVIGKTMDDMLVDVAKADPNFGGMFTRENVLHVYSLDPTQKSVATDAIVQTFGQKRIPENGVQMLQAQYSLTQLKSWYDAMWPNVLVMSGVVYTDLKEGSNRLLVGVESTQANKAVEQELARLGIPREAVIIRQVEPFEVLLHEDLRDRIDPLQGGINIEGDDGPTIGSLGFVTERGSETGLVTVAHLTPDIGVVEDTEFYQPTVNDDKIGTESIDPAPFTGGGCPVNEECRHSDSIFIELEGGISVDQGYIARPWNLGSISLAHSDGFRIVDEASPPGEGDYMYKVGRTSGWTMGDVDETCINSGLGDYSDVLLLCQYLVNDDDVGGGDSGGPVFKITNDPATDDVEIVGIVSTGGEDDYVFSYIGSIYLDLGSSYSWDTCEPSFSC